MCASMRVVVVLPLVPVTAAIGTREGAPGGNSISITGAATSRGAPSEGATCMRKPGAARILVHDLDQLLDRMLAVAHHVSGRAARGGDELAVDHQQAVIVSLEEALDDHRAGVLARHVEAVRHLLVGGEADGNAPAVV